MPAAKKYQKLVRDKIPTIIRTDGQLPVTRVAGESEYWDKLVEKLREEVEEFVAVPSLEELADIHEVLDAITTFKKFDAQELETVRRRKAQERGRFGTRTILERIEPSRHLKKKRPVGRG